MWSVRKRLLSYVCAFDTIKENRQSNPLEVFDLALKNAGPSTEVRSNESGRQLSRLMRQ